MALFIRAAWSAARSRVELANFATLKGSVAAVLALTLLACEGTDGSRLAEVQDGEGVGVLALVDSVEVSDSSLPATAHLVGTVRLRGSLLLAFVRPFILAELRDGESSLRVAKVGNPQDTTELPQSLSRNAAGDAVITMYPSGDALLFNAASGLLARRVRVDSGARSVVEWTDTYAAASVSDTEGLRLTFGPNGTLGTRAGLFAERFRGGRRSVELFGRPTLTAIDSVLAVSTAASDVVYLVRHGGRLDSIRVPRRTRMESPDDLMATIQRADSSAHWPPVASISSLAGTSDRRLNALWAIHVSSARETGFGVRFLFSSSRTAMPSHCVDVPVPGSIRGPRVTWLEADTVFVARQHLGRGGSRSLVITRFSFNPDACVWTNSAP